MLPHDRSARMRWIGHGPCRFNRSGFCRSLRGGGARTRAYSMGDIDDLFGRRFIARHPNTDPYADHHERTGRPQQRSPSGGSACAAVPAHPRGQRLMHRFGRRGFGVVQRLEAFINGMFFPHVAKCLYVRCALVDSCALWRADCAKCFRRSPAWPRSRHGQSLR